MKCKNCPEGRRYAAGSILCTWYGMIIREDHECTGEGNSMNDMRVIQEKSEKKPDYRKTAAGLLEACRAFYREPENEEAYTAWKKNGRNKKKAG